MLPEQLAFLLSLIGIKVLDSFCNGVDTYHRRGGRECSTDIVSRDRRQYDVRMKSLTAHISIISMGQARLCREDMFFFSGTISTQVGNFFRALARLFGRNDPGFGRGPILSSVNSFAHFGNYQPVKHISCGDNTRI